MADISSKVKVVSPTVLKLLEDCKKDDLIDLSKINQVDVNYINEIIQLNKEEGIKQRIEQEKLNYQIHLKDETDNITLKFENSQKDKINEIKSNYEKSIKNLQLENENLKTKLEELNNNLNTKVELEKEKNKQEIKIDYDKKIEELTEKINSLTLEKEELSNKIQTFSIEIEQVKSETKAKDLIEFDKQKDLYQKQIDDLKNDFNKLSLQKSARNVKQLGEELEKWCTSEFRNYEAAGAFNNCTWEKANDVKKDDGQEEGTKPDFYFKMYDSSSKENLLTSVCLEMKNESNVSTNKKKNADHFKKLDDDRNKRKLEYALLVSELEWDTDNDSPIRKVNEYENMYVVRPQYFISFLSIVYSLGLKYKDLITSKNLEANKFKESNKILEEFEEMKRKYFEDPIKKLEKEVLDIKKESDSIRVSADKISASANSIVTITLGNIKTKIERFDIKSTIKKIDKLAD